MTNEEYSEMENKAIQWLNETDTMQFSQMELLSMFAESQLAKEREENDKKIRERLILYDAWLFKSNYRKSIDSVNEFLTSKD